MLIMTNNIIALKLNCLCENCAGSSSCYLTLKRTKIFSTNEDLFDYISKEFEINKIVNSDPIKKIHYVKNLIKY